MQCFETLSRQYFIKWKDGGRIRRELSCSIGVYAAGFWLLPDFTGREFMYYMAAVKGLNEKEAKYQIEHLLQMVNLQEAANKKIKTYSGGMKQRLGIAQAELNNPAILILDEPTAGLDPKERVRFRNLIANFANEKIVILSTHIVSDVSYIADTILMMKNGKFLLQEPMNTITNCMEGKVWELLAAEHEVTEYNECFSVVNLHHENDTVRLRIVSDTAPSEKAVNVKPSLEDLFLYYFCGRNAKEGAVNYEDLSKI